MGNKKKSESISRYVIYALCGALLVLLALLRWGTLGELSRYLYLIIGIVWVFYGGIRALRLYQARRDDSGE